MECHCLKICLLHEASHFLSTLISLLRGRHFLLMLPFYILAGRRWCPSRNVVCVCGGPIELADTHDVCVFCLGSTGSNCPFCPNCPGYSQVSTAPSKSGDCSCQESEAPHIEVTKPLATVDEELSMILTPKPPKTCFIFPRGPWRNLVGLVLPLQSELISSVMSGTVWDALFLLMQRGMHILNYLDDDWLILA